MKQIILSVLIAMIGIFIFNMASERVLNFPTLAYLGLGIALCSIAFGIAMVIKIVMRSGSGDMSSKN